MNVITHFKNSLNWWSPSDSSNHPLPANLASLKELADAGDLPAQHQIIDMLAELENPSEEQRLMLANYLELIEQGTREKVDRVREKMLQKGYQGVAPTSMPSSAAVSATAAAALSPVAVSAAAAVAPLVALPTHIGASYIVLGRGEEELLSGPLAQLGIILDSSGNTGPAVDFIMMSAGQRGIDTLQVKAADIIARSAIMNVPLIVGLVSTDIDKLKSLFFDETKNNIEKQLVEFRKSSLGAALAPVDFMLAPLCEGVNVMMKPESIDKLRQEFAAVQNDPKEMRQFIVNVFKEFLRAQ